MYNSSMESLLNYISISLAILITILILIQTRGASLGAGLGGGGESSGESVRRGHEKTIHQITIILVIAFGMSLLASFLI